jgi:hypothetical protein
VRGHCGGRKHQRGGIQGVRRASLGTDASTRADSGDGQSQCLQGIQDRSDVTCKPSGHLPFGMGIHGCLGQVVARAEGEVLLAKLARKVGRIELDGEPQRHLNNAVRGLACLPVTFHAP